MNVENIKSPNDIKDLNVEQLNVLASDMRDFLIQSTSKTGGHLGSSLGTIELIIAMHYTFNSPEDKFIFDIGHQAYAHKILTGRAKDFATLRKKDGLSGFLKMDESEHDVWESGHSSTSISAASGYALERDLNNKDSEVVALIGDGSLTNGMAFEALNHIIELNQKVIVIINDNEMSISTNVGFIDNLMKNLDSSASYQTTKKAIKGVVETVDPSKTISKFISGSKNKIKENITGSSTLFNLLGFKYYGRVDGHNLDELINVFESAKKDKEPVIIHVKTTKGKGYKPAEKQKWHATAPFDLETGIPLKKSGITNGKEVAKHLDKLMEKDEEIVVITPAMLAGSSLNDLQAKYNARVTDAGIAEEHATTMAASLALAGKKPFLSIYSTFLQRSYDQTFHDIVRHNANVVIGIDRAGLVGEDGETHQGIYDISFLSHMPNLVIAHGKDINETKALMNLAFEYEGPFAFRYSKGEIDKNLDFDKVDNEIELGSWVELTSGTKLNVVSYGEDVNSYHELYKDNDEVGVINARFIKPLDSEMLFKIADRNILVVEEHIKIGGLGNQILNFYNENNLHPNIKIQAIEDHFVYQGTIEESKIEEKIDVISVQKNVEKILNEKN